MWKTFFSNKEARYLGSFEVCDWHAGKNFEVKSLYQKEAQWRGLPASNLNLSDIDGVQSGESNQFPLQFLKHPNDGAGHGFVTSITRLFSSQRRKAKAFVL